MEYETKQLLTAPFPEMGFRSPHLGNKEALSAWTLTKKKPRVSFHALS